MEEGKKEGKARQGNIRAGRVAFLDPPCPPTPPGRRAGDAHGTGEGGRAGVGRGESGEGARCKRRPPRGEWTRKASRQAGGRMYG